MLINFGNNLNVINFAYIAKLGFWVQKLDINSPKIDSFIKKIYHKVIAIFQIYNKHNYLQFFWKLSLLAKIKVEVVFDILFWLLVMLKSDLLRKNWFRKLPLAKNLFY